MQDVTSKAKQLVENDTRAQGRKSWHAPQLIVAAETENSSLSTTDAALVSFS
jgi:hypothetical protein